MTTPTLLVTGAAGQLGFELVRALASAGRVVAATRHDLDLRRPDAVRERLRALRPAAIVNAAAYTAVDRAETERDEAHAVNAVAPAVLGEEAARLGALLVHFSTDYVFDGAADDAYDETAAPRPLNVYGATKLEGEQALTATGCRHLVLRTGWVYGARGHNFLATMLRLATGTRPVRVVDDQRGAPTSTRLLASVTAQLLRDARVVDGSALDGPWGVYHVSAGGDTTWHGFAAAIFAGVARYGGHAAPLEAITTTDFPTAATRPRQSVLDTTKLRASFGVHLPPWDEQLALVLEERLAFPATR